MNSESKYLVKPGGLLLLVVVALILVFNFGSKQIYAQYTTLNEQKEMLRLLTLKQEVLTNVNDLLSENLTVIDVALPSKGSVLYGIAQVKKLSLEKNVLVTSIKTGGEVIEENGIAKNSINFEAEGSETDIYAFLNSFYKALPLMNLDRVRVGTLDGVTRAVITVNVYSANLPEKIPAVSDGVEGFSSSDIQTLNELSQFSLPDFVEPRPSNEGGRENPFN